jgi:hypothetical protein
MKIAVLDGKRVGSSGFREGDWPLNVWEINVPCSCGYTGEGEFIEGDTICNSKIICPVCGADLDMEVKKAGY